MKKMIKGISTLFKIFFLALITVAIAAFVLKKNYDTSLDTPNSSDTEKVELTIKEGDSVDSIIDQLEKAGVLKGSWETYFKVFLKLNNISPKIQAGTYQIPKNLTIKEIAETIQHAKNPDVWITIPEGLRKDEIANTLSNEFTKVNNTNFSKSDFLSLTTNTSFINTLGLPYSVSDLEGFLFPDKYAFEQDATTQEVIQTMVDNFKTKVSDTLTYNQLIIASLVEREGYSSQDRPIIADIIERRYNEGWLLQIDATLLYPLKDWKHVITDTDKQSNSPYNTYKKQGLPPTPICNPGLQSIEATINPQANKYYYYIHDSQGIAHYAETLTEHNQNVQQYLR